MSETNDNLTAAKTERKLADAVRSVKNAAADRNDVVIDMRDAERMRLELLANELTQVISDVPDDADMFDFAISSGLQPRFWVDSISHVAMGRDKRTYRFVRDTRNGRVVIKEAIDVKPVADAVTRYVAERMVERERMLDGGEPFSFRAPAASETASTEETGSAPAAGNKAEGSGPGQDVRKSGSIMLPATLPTERLAGTDNAAQERAELNRRESAKQASETSANVAALPETDPSAKSGFWRSALWGLVIFLLGGVLGFALMASQMWDQLVARISAL